MTDLLSSKVADQKPQNLVKIKFYLGHSPETLAILLQKIFYKTLVNCCYWNVNSYLEPFVSVLRICSYSGPTLKMTDPYNK